MTIKDLKTFLEQFDETERVESIHSETSLDICYDCDECCYDEEEGRCFYKHICQREKRTKNITAIRLTFRSDVIDEYYGNVKPGSYKKLVIEDDDYESYGFVKNKIEDSE